jgi:hypothetical protein
LSIFFVIAFSVSENIWAYTRRGFLSWWIIRLLLSVRKKKTAAMNIQNKKR